MKHSLSKHTELYATTERGTATKTKKLQGWKEIKMDWLESDQIQPTLMTAVIGAVIKFQVSLWEKS